MDGSLSVKLRPTKFEEFVGSKNIIEAIQKELTSGRMPRAWLLSGPTGVGKTTLARLIAHAINGGEAKELYEVNSSDFTGVDYARELSRAALFVPFVDKFKVFILDECQKLTDAAQQALLKPLEEEGTSVFIFCTTEPLKLIQPLRGRCLAFTLAGLIDYASRLELVTQTFKACDAKADQVLAVAKAIDAAGLSLPREILMAIERVLAGLSIEEAIEVLEADPLYIEIAKAVLNGQSQKLHMVFQTARISDIRGLRAVVSRYLQKAYHREKDSKLKKDLGDAVLGLAKYSVFEDGIALSVTAILLCQISERIATSRRSS